MQLNQIDPSKLNASSETQSLWFRSDDGDLYIIFKQNELCYFEITIDEHHLEGGHHRELRYGTLSEDQDHNKHGQSAYKLSRLVTYSTDMPDGHIKRCMDIVFGSKDLEKVMKEGLMESLSSQGKNQDLLTCKEGYKSFREIVQQPFNWKKFYMENIKKFRFLGGASVALILIGLVLWVIGFDKNPQIIEDCNNGVASACKKISYALLIKGKGAASSRYSELAKQYEKRDAISSGAKDCANNNKEGCEKLAENVENGELKMLNLACKGGQGDKTACLKVAKIHEKGIWEMEEYNYKSHKAYHHFQWASDEKNNYGGKIDEFYQNKKSCSEGKLENCHSFASTLLEQGFKKQAAQVFGQNCEKDFKKSCLMAAIQGIADDAKSYEYFQKACEAGAMKGCLFLKLKQTNDPEMKKQLRQSYSDCQKGDEKSCLKLKP